MKYHFHFRLYLSLALLILLGACKPDAVYQEHYDFKEDIWMYGDTVSFNFNIEDTSRRYNLYLDIDHMESYPFQNLYLKIHSIFPGDSITREQISLELQEKTGFWTGDCNSSLCKIRFVLREGLLFRETGQYGIKLEQFNRVDTLKGIRRAALYLEFAD